MKDLERLATSSSNPLTRELLACGRRDEPSTDGRRRAVLAVAAIGTVAVTSTAKAGGGAGVAAASKWLGSAGVTKWIATGVTGTLLGLGAAHEYRIRQAERAPVTQPQIPADSPQPAQRALPRRVVDPTRREAERQDTPPEIREARDAPPVRNASPSSSIAPPPKASAPAWRSTSAETQSLANEVAALDRVSAALSAGQPDVALAVIRSYMRQHAQGTLQSEAMVLRMQALVQARETDQARKEAEQFLARDPSSPHARRVEALLLQLGEGQRTR